MKGRRLDLRAAVRISVFTLTAICSLAIVFPMVSDGTDRYSGLRCIFGGGESWWSFSVGNLIAWLLIFSGGALCAILLFTDLLRDRRIVGFADYRCVASGVLTVGAVLLMLSGPMTGADGLHPTLFCCLTAFFAFCAGAGLALDVLTEEGVLHLNALENRFGRYFEDHPEDADLLAFPALLFFPFTVVLPLVLIVPASALILLSLVFLPAAFIVPGAREWLRYRYDSFRGRNDWNDRNDRNGKY